MRNGARTSRPVTVDRAGRARCGLCNRRRTIIAASELCAECYHLIRRTPDALGLSILEVFAPDLVEETLDELRAADVAAGSDRCRICGCTDNFGCADGCWWVGRGLCSVCADAEDRGPRVEQVDTRGLLQGVMGDG